MTVVIEVHGALRNAVGTDRLVLDMAGGTIKDVVECLAGRYGPRIRDELLDEQGNLDFYYAFFAGEKRLDHNLSAQIEDGTELIILPMMAGG